MLLKIGDMTSVRQVIQRSLLLIVLMFIITSLVALFTLNYSIPDARAINLSSSLRMQAYRIAYKLERGEAVEPMISEFNRTLNTSELLETQRWITAAALRRTYHQVQQHWQRIVPDLRKNPELYRQQLDNFVTDIDKFVDEMQYHVQFKVRMLTLFEGIGVLVILLITSCTLRFVRHEVINPLSRLVASVQQLEQRNFKLTLPPIAPNELGQLTAAFSTMADELAKLYQGLENEVQAKTASLQQANESLSFLYLCAQKLHAAPFERETLPLLLEKARIQQQLKEICLVRQPDLALIDSNVQIYPLQVDECNYGYLALTPGEKQPDARLLDNFAMLLAQVLHKEEMLLQQQRFLLMEERAVIARELHDSLAQSLSFLKIQMTLLKRCYQDGNASKAEQIMVQLDEGLSSAYSQLRELLGTFRLTIGDANLGEAIAVMLDQLRQQTPAQIVLDYQLANPAIEAGAQVHVLQLIREAVLNAIKHANPQQIRICCTMDSNRSVSITVEDDGIGIGSAQSALNHYGLAIMNERARKLQGQLTVANSGTTGTLVTLTFPAQLTVGAE